MIQTIQRHLDTRLCIVAVQLTDFLMKKKRKILMKKKNQKTSMKKKSKILNEKKQKF